jgi:1,4-dihydroxy-2-naphthoyl-CoA hydrolase
MISSPRSLFTEDEATMQPLPTLAELNDVSRNTMAGALGMEIVEASGDHIVMRMPISDITRQPAGILHGGATVALAETIASLGTWLGIDRDHFVAMGLEINCNHLRPVRDGVITGEGVPLHRGRTTWVWDIRVRDELGRLVAISRCTMAVRPMTEGA